MKKVLYVLLLIAELLADLAVLSLLSNGSFYIAIAAIVVIWAALLVYLILKLKKTDDDAAKRKLYIKIALAMASPLAIFVILVIGFVIAFSMTL